jgi:hypothetical protein
LPNVGLDVPIKAWNDQQGDLRAILMGHGSSPQPFYDLWFDYGYIMEVYKNNQLYLKYDITDGDTASSTGVYTTELLNNAGSTGSAGKKHDDGSFLFTAGAGDYGTYKFRLGKRTGNFEDFSAFSANFVYSAPVSQVTAPTVLHTSRNLVQKTDITIPFTGQMELWKNNVLLETISVTQGTHYFNPYEVGTYKFRMKDGANYSEFTSEVVYNYSPHSFNPVVSDPKQVGTPIVFSFTQDFSVTGESLVGSLGFGLRVRNLTTGAWTTVAQNGLTAQNTVSWTPTVVAEDGYQYDLFWGINNVGSHFDFMVNDVPISSALPIVTTVSPSLTEQTINGTGVAGSWIKVYKENVFAFQVSVNGSGAWSITPQTSGNYYFSQEESGKPESAKTAVSVVNQSQSPMPLIENTAPFYVDMIISGQAIYDAVVKVYKNGVYLETLPPQASDGSFGFIPTSTGSYQFTRTDVDRTESEKTNAISVTNAPLLVSAVPVVSTASPQFTGTAINGTGVAGATIKIYKNDVHLTNVIVDGNGNWSYTPNVDGNFTFSQTESGKTESAKTSGFVVNAIIAPSAPVITSGLNGQIGTAITGTISEAGTVLVFKDGNQISTIPNQTTSFIYTPQSTGNYTFKLQVNSLVSAFSGNVLVPNTYEYDATFNGSCGNVLEYAISTSIALVSDSGLVWQSSKTFSVLPSTQYFLHCREVNNHSVSKTVQVTTLP